jgi:mono/diheme cytochrome c family protein
MNQLQFRPLKLLTLVAVTVALSACAHTAMVPYLVSNPAYRNDLQAQNRGMLVYDRNCARCHGPRARGGGAEALILKTPPGNLARMAKEKSANTMVARIAVGKGAEMPGFKGVLTDQQMWEIVFWLQTL